jgi:hypothetical protein
MVDDQTLELLDSLIVQAGLTRERFDAFLRSKRSPVRGGKKYNFLLQQYQENKRIAQLGVRNFGGGSMETPPSIDVALMFRLRAALSQIDDDLNNACWQRGLLSRVMSESLRMAAFLSFTLPFARAAQSDTGVPASMLIAEAYYLCSSYFYGSGFQWKCPDSNDLFATGKSYASMLDAFIERASQLRDDRAFTPVMKSANRYEYIDRLERWSSKKYNAELVNTITAHNLAECDQMVPAF